MKYSYFFILLFTLSAFGFGSCSHKDPVRVELERIDSLASNRQPVRALELLDSIDYRSLSEPNQNLYDLLRIKARDKDFQVHRSNDVILRLVDYYRDHPGENRLSEALYYAGRVHFDMGDLPAALRYFQETLDYLKENSATNLELQELTDGQIADIYNSMRQYEAALPYISEAIDFSWHRRDTIPFISHMERKGSILLHQRKLKESEQVFHQTYKLSSKTSETELKYRQRMYLAAIKYLKGDSLAALQLIKDVPDSVGGSAAGTAYGWGARIYISLAKADTAFLYACKLLQLSRDKYKKDGYQILFTPELINFIPKDSILHYVSNYGTLMESFVSTNSDDVAKLQNTIYNYKTWERNYEKLKKQTIVNNWIILGLIIVFTCLLGALIKIMFVNKKYISKINSLSTELHLTHQAFNSQCNPETVNPEIINNADSIQSILRDAVLRRLADEDDNFDISEHIKSSQLIVNLLSSLDAGKGWSDNDTKWAEMETLVLTHYPNFKDRLEILAGRKLKKSEFRLALSIKCGLSPSQCSVLFNKVGSSITYRRKTLTKLLLKKEFSGNAIDHAIRVI